MGAAGKSCLGAALLASGVLAVGCFVAGWALTGSSWTGLKIGILAVLVAAAIPTFFCLPVWLGLLGQIVGGSMVGLRVWQVEGTAFVATFPPIGRSRWVWTWSFSRGAYCLFRSLPFGDARRQMTFVFRGGLYGCVAAVLLYALIGLGWAQTSGSFLAFLLVGAALIPGFQLASVCSHHLAKFGADPSHAGELMAAQTLLYQDWTSVRPRDFDKGALNAIADTREPFRIGYLLTYWNDVSPCGEEVQALRSRMADALEGDGASEANRAEASPKMAYFAAVCDRDLDGALSWLEGDLSLNYEQAIVWKNVTVLAVLVLQGDAEEAETLRALIMEEASRAPDDMRLYVEEHIARVMALAESDDS